MDFGQPADEPIDDTPPAPPEATLPPEVKPPVALATPQPRDLSEIPEELHKHMRSMSNAAFGTLLPIVRGFYQQKDKIRELELTASQAKQAPLDVENGYQLAPEYSAAVENYQQLSAEESFWQEQWVNCRSQRPWNNPKLVNGKLEYEETEPGPRAELFLQNKVAEAQQLKQRVTGDIQNLQRQHKEAHGNLQQFLTDTETKLFKNVKYNFDKDPIYSGLMQKLPVTLKSAPIYRIAMRLATLFYRQSQASKRQVTNTNFAKTIQTNQGGTATPSAGGAAAPSVTFDDFEKILRT